MKPQTMTGKHPSRAFLLIALSLVIMAPMCTGACVTSKAMDYAKSKASPSNIVEFTIGKVHSAKVHGNSDISILLELDHPNHPKSGTYTLTVPLPCLVGKADSIESCGFREKYIASVSGLPSYLYPMEKAKKFSGDIVQMKDSSSSSMRIEALSLHQDEAERLLELLGDLNRDRPGDEKVYVVNLLSNAAGKAPGEDPGKTVDENSTVEKSILLVCWPPMSSNPHLNPITIAGAYDDESTYLYYMLVPPALLIDSFIMMLALGAGGGVMY